MCSSRSILASDNWRMKAVALHVVACGDHSGEQILRDRLAGFVMAGEEIERRAVPTEVLHDLRGQLDEIPRHVGAREGFDRHLAEHAVQQVAELMEDRLDLVMGEQRGLAIHRRAHVADDQSEVRFAGAAGVQRVHPRAAAFRFARMPVGIERSEMRAGFRVMDFVKRNLGMPDFDVRC